MEGGVVVGVGTVEGAGHFDLDLLGEFFLDAVVLRGR